VKDEEHEEETELSLGDVVIVFAAAADAAFAGATAAAARRWRHILGGVKGKDVARSIFPIKRHPPIVSVVTDQPVQYKGINFGKGNVRIGIGIGLRPR